MVLVLVLVLVMGCTWCMCAVPAMVGACRARVVLLLVVFPYTTWIHS